MPDSIAGEAQTEVSADGSASRSRIADPSRAAPPRPDQRVAPASGLLSGMGAQATALAEAEEIPAASEGALLFDTGRARFRVNVTSNVGYFLLSVGVGLWLTPYLIRHLGVAAYGLVPLATSVTGYLALITVALNGSVGRFLTIDLARGDTKAANRTFNTAFLGSAALALGLLPVGAGLVVLAPNVLHVPAGHEGDLRWLFVWTVAAFLIGTVGASFSASTFVTKRFDLQSVGNAANLLGKVGIVILLFSVSSPALWQVGLAITGSAVVSFAASVWFWRKLTPVLRVRLSGFDRTRLSALLGMGGWLVVNQVGMILFLSVDLLVVNLVIGAEAAGRYAPVLQWSMLLRTMAGLVAGVLSPTIVTLYAWGDTERLVMTARRAVKLLGLAMALPIGLLCGFSRPLLEVWLGQPFGHLAPLMWLLVAPLCINLAVLPLFSINIALNRVRWPGIMAVAMGAMNVGLAVTLAGPVGWGIYGVGVAGAVMLTLKNAAFTPMYSAFILRRPIHAFLIGMAPALLGTAAAGSMAALVSSRVPLDSWLRLSLAGAAITMVYSALALGLGLSRDERGTVAGILFARRAGG